MRRLSLFLVLLVALPVLATPLEAWVAQRDPQILSVQRTPLPQGELVRVVFQSQVWQGIPWTHRLNLLIPREIKSNLAPLLVTGSGNGQEEIHFFSQALGILKAPMAILHDIPNQPLFGNLREDALIAKTFGEYLQTGDETWPLLFPMTAAVAAAMDVIGELIDPQIRFLVGGGSKRGWTTYLAGAIDTRVQGIFPAVYDNLNLSAQMAHQLDAWGEYSEQIRDYTVMDFPSLVQTPQGQVLAEMVDPYAFRDRLQLPKLIISGTNDPYWVLDALDLYWNDLSGPSYILYLPNTGHGIGDGETVLRTLVAFHASLDTQTPLPRLRWEREVGPEDLQFIVHSLPQPKQITLWTAHSPTRDFRAATWLPQIIPAELQTVMSIPRQEGVWTAVFAEVVYAFGSQVFSLTTQTLLGPPLQEDLRP